MKITQTMLNRAIERLVEESKTTIESYNCYGYSQLRSHTTGSVIESTLGDSKKDLYYQIQFYLQMKDVERQLKLRESK